MTHVKTKILVRDLTEGDVIRGPKGWVQIMRITKCAKTAIIEVGRWKRVFLSTDLEEVLVPQMPEEEISPHTDWEPA